MTFAHLQQEGRAAAAAAAERNTRISSLVLIQLKWSHVHLLCCAADPSESLLQRGRFQRLTSRLQMQWKQAATAIYWYWEVFFYFQKNSFEYFGAKDVLSVNFKQNMGATHESKQHQVSLNHDRWKSEKIKSRSFARLTCEKTLP